MPEMETLEFGAHAVVFAGDDIAAAAKALKGFIKEHEEQVEVAAGIVEGQILTADQVQELADMPSLEQSVAMIAGLLTQPVSGVVNVLEDSVRSYIIILDQAFQE